jgi:hypothetical protein
MKQEHPQIGQSARSFEDDSKDELARLPLWYGDPNLDILTPECWIGSVQRAKELLEWDEETTMTNVVHALLGEAFQWFLQLVTKQHSNLRDFK